MPSKFDSLKSAFGRKTPPPADKDAAQPPAEAAPAAPAQPALQPTQPKPEPYASDDQTRLAALYRVSRILGTSLEVDEVLGQVMDAVIELTGAERGLLVLTESDSQDWTLRVSRNFNEKQLKEWEKEVSRTVINTALQTGKGVVTADAQTDPRFSAQASVVFNVLRSTMCTPLLARGRLLGAIYVDSRIQKDIFDNEDLEMLDALAIQAAFALDNARIYTRTVQQVHQLTIELDEARKAHQVAEITETDYFKQLQARAQALRDSTAGKGG